MLLLLPFLSLPGKGHEQWWPGLCPKTDVATCMQDGASASLCPAEPLPPGAPCHSPAQQRKRRRRRRKRKRVGQCTTCRAPSPGHPCSGPGARGSSWNYRAGTLWGVPRSWSLTTWRDLREEQTGCWPQSCANWSLCLGVKV